MQTFESNLKALVKQQQCVRETKPDEMDNVTWNHKLHLAFF